MCTAATYKTSCHYFGRTLDLEHSYCESVTVTPRNYPFVFRQMGAMPVHHAIIGMAYVVENYPLYYDATNEKGLSMAGLNFPGSAVYHPVCPSRDNVASFEFIPWVLGQCSDLNDARRLLERLNLTHLAFSPSLPPSPLHWIITDRNGAITVECMADGLHVYDNPVGVLTNNPPFDYQLFHLNNFRSLTADPPENRFCPQLDLNLYSRGMGAMGLPGDPSSPSRFIRAVFTRLNSRSDPSESESISQFFHILGTVVQPRGCVRLDNGQLQYTIYTSCCNTDLGIYYYTTYENSRISGVDLHRENLDSRELICYPLITGQQIHMQN